jgi:hypothetical protein
MKAYCTQNTDRECREEDCCLMIDTKKVLKRQLDLYHGFTIRVSQILTSKSLDAIEQRNTIGLTYAKLVWPDLWNDEQEKQLNLFEKRI